VRRWGWGSARGRRVDGGEDPAGAGPEGVELRSELVGERDLLLDQVLARPGQRPERFRLVAVGLEQPQPVHVRAGELGQDVGVEAVRLATGAVAVAGRGQLVGMDGNDGDAGVEEPVDDEPVGLLDRDPCHLLRSQSPDELCEAVLAMDDASLVDPAAAGADNEPVLLAGQVEAGGALLHRTSFIDSRAGCGPTGEVPWRMLIDGPSAGRRPVAAPGASHRREAQVSCGPSKRQATRALSRRWSATNRRYELRRSTPAMTACGRTLRFQRTEKTNTKVDQ
jgi:hypothetical protein